MQLTPLIRWTNKAIHAHAQEHTHAHNCSQSIQKPPSTKISSKTKQSKPTKNEHTPDSILPCSAFTQTNKKMGFHFHYLFLSQLTIIKITLHTHTHNWNSIIFTLQWSKSYNTQNLKSEQVYKTFSSWNQKKTTTTKTYR